MYPSARQLSSVSIPVARAVSTPLRLPMVSYGSWSSELDDTSKLPFFLRVCTSNLVYGELIATLLEELMFSRFAIITTGENWAVDLGKQVAKEATRMYNASVLYTGSFPELPNDADHASINASVQALRRDHTDAMAAAGIRIIVFLATYPTSMCVS